MMARGQNEGSPLHQGDVRPSVDPGRSISAANQPSIAVVFSKDRPLQLDATLASLAKHCTDLNHYRVVVLYKTSSSYFEGLYHELRAAYPEITFRREHRFKADLRNIVVDTRCVGFIVDDTLFVRDFSFEAATRTLENDDRTIGFSLRLGTNTTYCYPMDASQELPDFTPKQSGIVSFWWPGSSHDFGYPLELSSSIYRTEDLERLLQRLPYTNPNTLESQLAANAATFATRRPVLLCFERSVAFSVPANLVQNFNNNRISALPNQSSAELAAIFERGGRIDVERYDDFPNNACHQEVQLEIREPIPVRPTVSVVIPCFQQAEYLGDAVASVIAQTWSDWEIVIVDGGSADGTAETARHLIETYPHQRIRLVEQQDQGLATARNNGIAASTGRYVLPLDAEDMLVPTMLERTVALLESDPSIAIAYTDVQRFGAGDGVIRAADFDPEAILESNQLPYCSLYRRQVWQATGGYNPSMVRGYEHWDFWVGCVELGYAARRIPEALLVYRVRPGMTWDAVAHDVVRRQIQRTHPRLYGLRRRLRRSLIRRARGGSIRLRAVLGSGRRV